MRSSFSGDGPVLHFGRDIALRTLFKQGTALMRDGRERTGSAEEQAER